MRTKGGITNEDENQMKNRMEGERKMEESRLDAEREKK